MQIIRLSKVIRELGVGASTAVEFLQKKGYDIDNNLNAKISEEQYNVLQKEFSKDKKQKEESNKFFQERQNNKERNRVTVSTGEQNKKREELIEVTLPETDRPRIKEVGKIDLDALNKRPATNVAPAAKETVIEKAQPEQKVMAEPKKETPVISAPEQKPQVKVVEKVEVSQPAAQSKPAEKPKKTENKPVAKEVKPAEKISPEKPIEKKPVEKKVVEEKPQPKPVEEKPVVETIEVSPEEDVFTLGAPELKSKLNVVGQIDLDSLNQSTRPKKKSKEARRLCHLADATGRPFGEAGGGPAAGW